MTMIAELRRRLSRRGRRRRAKCSSGGKDLLLGELLQQEDRERCLLAQTHGSQSITLHMRRITLDWVYELIDTTDGVDSVRLFSAFCVLFDRLLTREEISPAELQCTALALLLTVSSTVDPARPIAVLPRLENIRIFTKQEELRSTLEELVARPLCCPTEYLKPLSGVLLERHGYGATEEVLRQAHTLLPLALIECPGVSSATLAAACILQSCTMILGKGATGFLLNQIASHLPRDSVEGVRRVLRDCLHNN